MSGRDIFLLAAVGISLPFCLLRPAYGIIFWTLLSILDPQTFTWGISRQIPLAQAVAICSLAGFVFTGRFQRLFCREIVLLGMLWLWFTLTTVNSVHTPGFSDRAVATWFRWGVVSKLLFMTVLSVGIINTRARLRWMVLAIGGAFAILVLHALPGIILSGGEYRVYGPDDSMLANNNAFGLAVNMALPFLFFLAKTESNRYLNWLFGLAFLGAIPVCFFTYSRGALVGLVAVAICMLLLLKQKLLLILVAFLAVLFAAFLAPQKLRDRIGETTDTQEASARSRLNAWTYSWNLANDYPVMGGGFEAWTPALFARYAPNPRDVHGPHSIYFGVLVEHGFVGFFLYFLVVADCFVVLRRIVRLSHLHGDEQSAHYGNMLRLSLVGFLTSGAFLGHTYFHLYFAIVACTAMLKQVCYEEWAARSDSEEDVAVIDLPALSTQAGA